MNLWRWRSGGAAAAELLRRGPGGFPLCALAWGVGAVAGLLRVWKSLGREERWKRPSKKEERPTEEEANTTEGST